MTKKSIYKKRKKGKPARLWGFPKERDYILENLALLLSAGMGVAEAANIVSSGLKSKQLKRVMAQVIEDVDSGSMLWKALSGSGIVGENYINLIKVGEESGRLVDNLRLIVAQQQKSRAFKAKLISAMSYPIIVFALMIIVGLGASWFMLPKILSSFSDMSVKVPLVTQVVMNFGTFLQNYGIIFVPTVLVGTLLFIYTFFVFRPFRFIGQSFLMWLPGVGSIIRDTEISRLGFVLGGLLESGLPVVEAVDYLENTSVYRPYTKLYAHLEDKINDGYSFQKSFESYKRTNKLIPVPIQQLLFAGERSGNFTDVLYKISEIYSEKVDASADNLSIIVEPILLFVVGLGVLIIGLSVILPIYTLVGSIGG